MCDENKNGFGMRDDRNLNSVMRDEITCAGADVFKLSDGIREQPGEIGGIGMNILTEVGLRD